MNFTSIEESKKLVELGVDLNTADMFYEIQKNYNDDGTDQTFVRVGEFPKLQFKYYEYIPCWSTGVLIDLLPKIIIDNNHNYYLDIDVNSAMPVYSYDNFNNYLYGFPNDFLGGDLINNLIKCIEWLKEHKHM